MNDVSLLEMLNAREIRSTTQRHLVYQYKQPLICFTLNIPGPVKILPRISEAFEQGCKRIEATLKEQDISYYCRLKTKEKTGYEAFYTSDSMPHRLKTLMISIEEKDEIGRLFDIEVLDTKGEKVSREDLGFPSRSCLLCQKAAHVCWHSHSHSAEELLNQIQRILERI